MVFLPNHPLSSWPVSSPFLFSIPCVSTLPSSYYLCPLLLLPSSFPYLFHPFIHPSIHTSLHHCYMFFLHNLSIILYPHDQLVLHFFSPSLVYLLFLLHITFVHSSSSLLLFHTSYIHSSIHPSIPPSTIVICSSFPIICSSSSHISHDDWIFHISIMTWLNPMIFDIPIMTWLNQLVLHFFFHPTSSLLLSSYWLNLLLSINSSPSLILFNVSLIHPSLTSCFSRHRMKMKIFSNQMMI